MVVAPAPPRFNVGASCAPTIDAKMVVYLSLGNTPPGQTTLNLGERGHNVRRAYELMTWSLFYLALDPSDRYYVA